MIEYKIIIQYWHEGVVRVLTNIFSDLRCAKGCLSVEKDRLGKNFINGVIQKITVEDVASYNNSFRLSVRTSSNKSCHTFTSLDSLFDFIKSLDDLIEFKVYARN